MSDHALTDSSLTLDGAPPRGGSDVLIIGCGALAREILAVVRANGLDHVAVTCLPAILHNHPERIPAAVEAAVQAHSASYTRIFVAYADCGTGGLLQATCERLGVEMISGPHCYSFFEGNDAFAARGTDDMTVFYLTDFLARQFDAFVWQPLGLDRHPELRDMYFAHYDRLVYQAQTDDPALTRLAEDAAARLGLTFERRFTGYGDLEGAVQAAGVAPAPEVREA